MRIAIVGSRTFSNYELLKESLKPYVEKATVMVSGGAKGADSLGEAWAKENNIKTQIFYPDWNKWGNAAGVIRNRDIIDNCDICIAFWDGKSRGTKSSIDLCKTQKKEIVIVYI